MPTLADILEVRTAAAAPELTEHISKDRIRCYACGHECPIPDGAVGVELDSKQQDQTLGLFTQ